MALETLIDQFGYRIKTWNSWCAVGRPHGCRQSSGELRKREISSFLDLRFEGIQVQIGWDRESCRTLGRYSRGVTKGPICIEGGDTIARGRYNE